MSLREKDIRVVIDELILFARGVFGEDLGYTWMDQNLKDRLLGMPRAKELVIEKKPDVPLERSAARYSAGPESRTKSFCFVSS